jgi:hypothetical protein
MFYYSNKKIQKLGFKIIICLLLLFFEVSESKAQTASIPTEDETWPELDVFYRFSKEFRVMGLASYTKQGSAHTDGALALNCDFFAFPAIRKIKPGPDSTRGYFQWFRFGVKYDRPDPADKNPVPAYTLRTESNTQFYPGWESMITVRNRFDFMDKAGTITTRYMPRITWEKDFQTTYLTFTAYIYPEYYAYFDDAVKNRFSIAIGAITKISRLLVFDVYYLYQFQHQPKVGALHVIGMTLKFYLPFKK